MELKEFLSNNKKHSVKILNQSEKFFELEINGKNVQVKVVRFDSAHKIAYLEINGHPHKISIQSSKNDKELTIFFLNLNLEIVLQNAIYTAKTESIKKDQIKCETNEIKFLGAEKLSIKSPLTGRITKIFVKHGERVNKNSPLLAIESMKMENEIRAPFDAFVKNILISEGNLIQQNQVMITFEKKGESNAGDTSNK